MNNDVRLMNPITWAKQIPIKGHAYQILQILANESDLYGKGVKSKAYLVVKSGLKKCEIDNAINELAIKKIASITSSHNSNFSHFQLFLHVPPTKFMSLSN